MCFLYSDSWLQLDDFAGGKHSPEIQSVCGVRSHVHLSQIARAGASSSLPQPDRLTAGERPRPCVRPCASRRRGRYITAKGVRRKRFLSCYSESFSESASALKGPPPIGVSKNGREGAFTVAHERQRGAVGALDLRLRGGFVRSKDDSIKKIGDASIGLFLSAALVTEFLLMQTISRTATMKESVPLEEVV